MPEVPIDPRRLAKILGLARQPVVRRLLVAFHFLLRRAGRLGFTIGEKELAGLVWGGRRPRHWRTFLPMAVARAAAATWGWSKPPTRKMPAWTYDAAAGVYTVRLLPRFLMPLKHLVEPGRLVLRKRNPDLDGTAAHPRTSPSGRR